mmetsp:Transcript_13947/g.34896  ORF Transcript_13947/g.34896 Transcript_13947/m.34896 type:complete len:685 (-) Transcript_13947:128-2182(-)
MRPRTSSPRRSEEFEPDKEDKMAAAASGDGCVPRGRRAAPRLLSVAGQLFTRTVSGRISYDSDDKDRSVSKGLRRINTHRVGRSFVRRRLAVIATAAFLIVFSLSLFYGEFKRTMRFYRDDDDAVVDDGASAFDEDVRLPPSGSRVMMQASEVSALIDRRDALIRGDQNKSMSKFGSGIDLPPYDLLACVYNCDTYEMRLRRGYRRMERHVKLIIAGMVKNNKLGAARMIRMAKKTCVFFADCHVVIYENDSTDGTTEFLRDTANLHSEELKRLADQRITLLMDRDPDDDISDTADGRNWRYMMKATPPITLIQETNVSGQLVAFGAGEKLASKRYVTMANLRNKVLAAVLDDTSLAGFTHVAMIDFDLQSWAIDGVANSFGWEAAARHELEEGYMVDPLWGVPTAQMSDLDANSAAKLGLEKTVKVTKSQESAFEAKLEESLRVDGEAGNKAAEQDADDKSTQKSLRPRRRLRQTQTNQILSLDRQEILGGYNSKPDKTSGNWLVSFASSGRISNGLQNLPTRNWDAIAANGLKPRIGNWMNYYDTLAFVDSRGLTPRVAPTFLSQITQHRIRPRPVMQIGEPLVPVKSAFGGLAIYKRDSLAKVAKSANVEKPGLGGPYSGNHSEHVNLHTRMDRQNMQLYVNPSLIVLAGDNCNSANRVSLLERAIYYTFCDTLHSSVIGI